eukprot:4239126-Prorocentrum_lima.AAC.1
MVIATIIQLKEKAEAADGLFFPGDVVCTEAVKRKDHYDNKAGRVLNTPARFVIVKILEGASQECGPK